MPMQPILRLRPTEGDRQQDAPRRCKTNDLVFSKHDADDSQEEGGDDQHEVHSPVE